MKTSQHWEVRARIVAPVLPDPPVLSLAPTCTVACFILIHRVSHYLTKALRIGLRDERNASVTLKAAVLLVENDGYMANDVPQPLDAI